MTTEATSTGERRSQAPDWDALYIGGHWVSRAGRPAFEVVSPHDSRPVGRAPMATTADVDLAVAGARAAFDHGPWPHLEPGARAEALRRFADIYQAGQEEMARLITAESGSPITFSRLAQSLAPWSLLDT
ncbi:MAG: aldehyde dehydrogenase family protein, partial [Acidimicrobiales bacterium]